MNISVKFKKGKKESNYYAYCKNFKFLTFQEDSNKEGYKHRDKPFKDIVFNRRDFFTQFCVQLSDFLFNLRNLFTSSRNFFAQFCVELRDLFTQFYIQLSDFLFNLRNLFTSRKNRKIKVSGFKKRFNKHFSLFFIKASFLEAFDVFMCVKSSVMHKFTHYKKNAVKYCIISTAIIALNPTAVNAKSGLLGKLGMSSNYNGPEVWQDQLGNYATGGSLYARTPTSELQLLNFDMPSIDSGCGGININFGGFGYISGDQIQQLIKQIGTNALSYTVMLTIKSISPQISDLLENLEAMARFMNAQNINRVERRIAAPPSHTTVQAMSHTAVSDLCLPKAEYIEKRLIFSK